MLQDGTLIIEIPVLDNSSFQPPQSPTTTSSLNKQFSDFSLSNASNQQSQISGSTSSSQNALLATNNGTIVEGSNGGKELKLTFDLAGYKPEDLSIKVIDNNILKVHAVHIDNSRGNQIHREYTRQYVLPEWVQQDLLRARMSENGTLTVELPQVQQPQLERLINIQNSS